MQLIAVSLIGIPGSGKSTFARELVEMSKKNLLQAGVIVISFDDYIKMDYSKLADGVYKQCREKLMNDIHNLMSQFRENGTLSSHELKLPETNLHLKTNLPTLIVLDDNIYFRSMRQRVRAICRINQCNHFQIFLKTSLEEAKERNLKRVNAVPEKIIEKMFNNLEAPVNPRTIFIESMTTFDENLLALLHDRIENPENIEDPEESPKTPQQQSVIHEADLITRRELSARIKNLRVGCEISQVCSKLNQKRKEFLEDLRAQKFDVHDVESLRAAFNCYLDE